MTLAVRRPVRLSAAALPAAPSALEVFGGPTPVFYPEDKLFTCEERERYEDETMLLHVPKLGLCAPVQNGTSDAALAQGVGLYEVSPMPGTGNANVSIAGHRGAAGCEFYAIDTLCEGDALYLEYKGVRYTYVWEETVIVESTDWSPIACADGARVTLTSCHPITGGGRRICAVGRLVCAEDIV